jgi:pimeloyl-ACP methyl ester carboxylesterase
MLTTGDGTRLAVVDFGGSGPPILLLHGLMGRATTWWAVSRWLVEFGHVVGLDARGHGRSAAAGPWSTERMVADVADALRELRLGPATVIGHSMGGLHGWELAAAHPELVSALVVEDMAPDFRGRDVEPFAAWFGAQDTTFETLAAVREAFGWPRPSVGDYMAECVTETSDGYRLLARAADMVAIASEWSRRQYWDGWRRVSCPALLLEAEESITPPGQLAQMAAEHPGARHVRVGGTGHLLHADAPTAYRELVTDFVLHRR